jgi:glycosyltransferase involved in cell wall biosynthesis
MTRIIDIVIPCAGRAHDLLRLLASIHERCAESLPRLCASITVTDDRSTEALRDEVRRRFPAVNYVAGPSRGPAVNRNHGSTFGSAEWLLFLDDDCYLQAERLKTHRALIVFADDAVVYHPWRSVSETEVSRAIISHAIYAHKHSAFVRSFNFMHLLRALRGRVRPYRLGRFSLCRDGAGAWFVRERLSAWRAHFGNLSSQGGLSWLYGSATCWQAVAQDARFAPAHRTARDKAALGYYGCAVRSWGSGQRVDCLRYTLRSLQSSLTARGVAALLLPLLPQRLAEMRQSLRRTA